MRDHPKDIPTPSPPDTRPDAYEVVTRATWRTRFDDARVPEALETVGRMLTDSHQEGHSWGTTHNLGVVRCGFAAVADDLESLADFLDREVAKRPRLSTP